MPDILDRVQRVAERPTAALLHEERCLAQRGLPEPCTVCRDACPVEAVSFDQLDTAMTHEALGVPGPTRPRIDAEACASCGRCVTACPTGALGALGSLSDGALLDAVQRAARFRGEQERADRTTSTTEGTSAHGSDGFDASNAGPQSPSDAVDASGQPDPAKSNEADVAQVTFVCERDATGVGTGGAPVVLPCLAWIDEALIVHAVTAGAQIVSLPVRVCTACSQQHAVHDLPRIVQQAQRIIDLWELGGIVELVDERRDADGAARDEGNGDLSRRGLFSRARATLVDAATSAAALHLEAIVGAPDDKGGTEPDARRWRMLDGLHAAGLPSDTAIVPRALAPRVDIDIDRCSGCAQCALFCPTGALRKAGKAAGGMTLLEFDPARCRDCGVCEQTCRYAALACDESLTAGELFALDPIEIVIPKRRVLPERRRA